MHIKTLQAELCLVKSQKQGILAFDITSSKTCAHNHPVGLYDLITP